MDTIQAKEKIITIEDGEDTTNVTSRGIFDIFSKNDSVENEEPEEKVEIITSNDQKSDKVKKPTDKSNGETVINIKPSIPTHFPQIDLYEEEPLVKDVPLDLYDDSIKIEPQNPKKKNYSSVNSDDPNQINLYEDTPEMKKTIFQKIKQVLSEIIRLILVAFYATISFIWSIIGGFVMAIWFAILYVYRSILKAIYKCIFQAAMRRAKEGVNNQINEIKENIWDINRMVITTIR